MTFQNGKFYNSDGVNVPLEFGNKEQIKILDRVKNLMGDGEPIRFLLDGKGGSFTTEHKCICGAIHLRFWNEERLIETHKTPFKFKCTGCNNNYAIDTFDLFLVIKLLKP